MNYITPCRLAVKVTDSPAHNNESPVMVTIGLDTVTLAESTTVQAVMVSVTVT